MAGGYFASSDPFVIGPKLSTLFRSAGLSISGHPATGDLTVTLPRATYDKIQGGKKLVIDRSELTTGNAPEFVRFFEQRNSADEIPWILGPASAIPGVGSAITFFTSGMDALRRLRKGSVDADQLSALMADGGVFSWVLTSESPERVTSIVFYTVKVGNETRMYALYTATYGLKVAP